jgi:hypothetical protein
MQCRLCWIINGIGCEIGRGREGDVTHPSPLTSPPMQVVPLTNTAKTTFHGSPCSSMWVAQIDVLSSFVAPFYFFSQVSMSRPSVCVNRGGKRQNSQQVRSTMSERVWQPWTKELHRTAHLFGLPLCWLCKSQHLENGLHGAQQWKCKILWDTKNSGLLSRVYTV